MFKRVVLCGLVCMTMTATVWAAEFTDTSGHWAEVIINKWSDLGLINGYGDGSFKPESGITRAEFVTLINQAFGYNGERSEPFSDVNEKDWYYKQVRRALEIGYISGYEDRTFRPGNNVSRQEAAAILVRIMNNTVTEKSQYLYRYYDVLEIPDWSWLYLETAAKEGYLKSYEDQTIRPLQPITRAETVYALEQILGPGYVREGRYGPESGTALIEGNVVISSDDVTLRNTEIQGDLYLTEGIGDGDVILDHVTVHGTTRIKGGGDGTISLRDTTLGETMLQKKDGQIKLELRDQTAIENLLIHSGAVLDASKLNRKSVKTVKIYYGYDDQEVALTGTFGNVELFSGDMSLRLKEGEMNDLIIHDEVGGADIRIQDFEMDDLQLSDAKSSTYRIENSTLDEISMNHKQEMSISDTIIKTMTVAEDVKSLDLTMEYSTLTTLNVDCPIELSISETDILRLNLRDESGDMDMVIKGGIIDNMTLYEKVDLTIERVAVGLFTLKDSAEKSTVNVSTDSYIEALKVYGEATFKGRGDILEAFVYEDDVSFVETPHQLTANEELTISTGSSSYSGSLLWQGRWEETDRNNGRVEGSVHVTLIGDEFADTIRVDNEIKVNNLPVGLYAEVSRLNDTELEIRLEGTALKHADSNDTTGISVTLNTQAFSTLASNKVKNATKKKLAVNFRD